MPSSIEIMTYDVWGAMCIVLHGFMVALCVWDVN